MHIMFALSNQCFLSYFSVVQPSTITHNYNIFYLFWLKKIKFMHIIFTCYYASVKKKEINIYNFIIKLRVNGKDVI